MGTVGGREVPRLMRRVDGCVGAEPAVYVKQNNQIIKMKPLCGGFLILFVQSVEAWQKCGCGKEMMRKWQAACTRRVSESSGEATNRECAQKSVSIKLKIATMYC